MQDESKRAALELESAKEQNAVLVAQQQVLLEQLATRDKEVRRGAWSSAGLYRGDRGAHVDVSLKGGGGCKLANVCQEHASRTPHGIAPRVIAPLQVAESSSEALHHKRDAARLQVGCGVAVPRSADCCASYVRRHFKYAVTRTAFTCAGGGRAAGGDCPRNRRARGGSGGTGRGAQRPD